MTSSPKQIRKVQEEFGGGHSLRWLVFTFIYAVTCLVPLLLVLLVPGWYKVPVGVSFTGLLVIYLVHFRNDQKLTESFTKISYVLKARRGETVIAKYRIDPAFLKSIFPLETVHDGGLIEYTNSRYGVLFKLTLPRKDTDELPMFINLVTDNIINRIHDGQVMKLFTMKCRIESASVQNKIVDKMNDTDKTSNQKEHLYSLYNQINNVSDVPTETVIFMLVGLGRFKTVDEANDIMNSLLPALSDGLQLAGIGYRQLIDPVEIGFSKRRCVA